MVRSWQRLKGGAASASGSPDPLSWCCDKASPSLRHREWCPVCGAERRGGEERLERKKRPHIRKGRKEVSNWRHASCPSMGQALDRIISLESDNQGDESSLPLSDKNTEAQRAEVSIPGSDSSMHGTHSGQSGAQTMSSSKNKTKSSWNTQAVTESAQSVKRWLT